MSEEDARGGVSLRRDLGMGAPAAVRQSMLQLSSCSDDENAAAVLWVSPEVGGMIMEALPVLGPTKGLPYRPALLPWQAEEGMCCPAGATRGEGEEGARECRAVETRL